MRKSLEVRFFEKVKKTKTCWLWMGGKIWCGYGKFWYNNHRGLAHRFAYEYWNGPIQKGKLVLHSCDVRHCVNPAHLFIGTNKDNIIDAAKKGRVSGQKLSIKNVETIRLLLKDGQTHIKIAEQFGVSRPTISLLAANKTFSYV